MMIWLKCTVMEKGPVGGTVTVHVLGLVAVVPRALQAPPQVISWVLGPMVAVTVSTSPAL